MAKSKPVPTPTSITREFWERAREGRLVIPRCLDCGTYTYYPRTVCMRCMSRNLEWREVSGRGTVYSYSIVYAPPAGFEADAPYVIAAVDLEEGTRMMTHLLKVDPSQVKIGMPVRIVFEPISEAIHLPQAEPLAASW